MQNEFKNYLHQFRSLQLLLELSKLEKLCEISEFAEKRLFI